MQRNSDGRIETTLLELVDALSASAQSDAEVVAVVHGLLDAQRVRLIGSFRDCVLEDGAAEELAGAVGWE